MITETLDQTLPACTLSVTIGCICRQSSMICQSVAIVSPAKTAELVETPFGLWTRVGARNHVLDGKGNYEARRGSPLYSIGTTIHVEQ